MATLSKTRWHVKGTVVISCNCDYGCPCNFNARPTQGKCEGQWVWHVEEGSFGDVRSTDSQWSVDCGLARRDPRRRRPRDVPLRRTRRRGAGRGYRGARARRERWSLGHLHQHLRARGRPADAVRRSTSRASTRPFGSATRSSSSSTPITNPVTGARRCTRARCSPRVLSARRCRSASPRRSGSTT